MKALKICIMTAALLLPFVPSELRAGSETNPAGKATTETPESAARAKILLNRLEEIKALDKSKLTSAEKKQLRKEVKSSKKELDELGGGIYLSVGAIILILVLLIIFL
jgi:hypothetical protein